MNKSESSVRVSSIEKVMILFLLQMVVTLHSDGSANALWEAGLLRPEKGSPHPAKKPQPHSPFQ